MRIPADESQPFEQLEAILANDAHGDILPDVLAPFSGGGSIDRRAAREQAVRQLGEKGLELSQDALDNATKQGATETFALVRPSSTNNHRGVYLYLDEVGLLKGLRPTRGPTPSRDPGVLDGVSFYGDMYAGSIKLNPPRWSTSISPSPSSTRTPPGSSPRALRTSSTISPCSSSRMPCARRAAWPRIRRRGGDGVMPGGEGDDYAWSQTDDEVEMVVDVPAGTKAKDVKVAFKAESVEVVVGGAATAKAERLYRRVRPDECTWTIEGGKKVVVTLAKVDEQVWHAIEAVE